MKNKTLLIALIVLLISNAIFAYLLVSKKKHGGKFDMIERQLKQIGFDQIQADSFIAQRKASKEATQPIMDSMHAARSRYMDVLLKNPNDSLTIFSLMNESNKWVYKMDRITYTSLQEARKICKPNQLAAYDSMVLDRMYFRNMKKDKTKK